MTFLSPNRLWLLLAVAALAIGYVVVQRQRKNFALRFASSELFASVAPERPGYRRHVPAVVFLSALAVLVGALAQPARQVRVPRERATVIVAIDVSLSMDATDVEPNRLQAAQTAAKRFIDELPPTLNVGIVALCRLGFGSGYPRPPIASRPTMPSIHSTWPSRRPSARPSSPHSTPCSTLLPMRAANCRRPGSCCCPMAKPRLDGPMIKRSMPPLRPRSRSRPSPSAPPTEASSTTTQALRPLSPSQSLCR